MDRFDLRVDVPPVAFSDLGLTSGGETSAQVAMRVAAAREIQIARFEHEIRDDGRGFGSGGAHGRRHAGEQGEFAPRTNADLEGKMLENLARPDPAGQDLLLKAADRFGLSARGYHRILRVARTIADLDGADTTQRDHIAEAISFRLPDHADALAG